MPHVWALIRTIGIFNRTKDKRDMNAKTVVRLITGSDSDSDWNDSDGADYSVREDSYRVDRLTMDQGKMADTRG